MKKVDLKKLALMGITGGILLAQPAVQADGAPIPGYPSVGCSANNGCQGMSGEYSGDYYGQGFDQGYPISQGCGGQQGFQNGQSYGGYPIYQGGASCGGQQGSYSGYQGGASCGSQQGAYNSTSGYQGQGGHGCGGATSYYSNPNTTLSNQPGQSAYRNYQNPQDANQQNQSTTPSTQMPQQMMPQGSQTPQKSSYNQTRSRWYTAQNDDPSDQRGTMTSEPTMSEADLMSKLNDQGKAMFKSLSPEGKTLALKLASQSCKGKNSCKGLNSCKSDQNSCAGQGGCSGKSQCSFKDKNVAVKVAAKKMAEKRAMMSN